MKKIFGILILSALMSIAYGQRSIDALFEKYADNDGFVTLTINGDLSETLKIWMMRDVMIITGPIRLLKSGFLFRKMKDMRH